MLSDKWKASISKNKRVLYVSPDIESVNVDRTLIRDFGRYVGVSTKFEAVINGPIKLSSGDRIIIRFGSGKHRPRKVYEGPAYIMQGEDAEIGKVYLRGIIDKYDYNEIPINESPWEQK
jgi:hypothetical protein